MSNTWKSALIRAARTFLQAFLAVYMVGLYAVGAQDRSLEALTDMPLIEKAVFAGVVAVLSGLHRLLDAAPLPTLADTTVPVEAYRPKH